MALNFSVFNKFNAVDGVTAPIKKMEKSVGKFGKTTTREFKKADKAATGLSKRLKTMGGLAAGAVSIGAITAGLADVVKTGAEFEQTLVNAAAKFGGLAKKGTEAFNALENAAAKAGKSTEFSSIQAAEGLNYLAMAGFDVKQSIAALPGVIDLATAAQIDLSQASDMATDTLGSFGLAVKDSIQLQKNLARVTDVMAKTTTSANVDIEQLFETFTEAGPVGVGLGASIETVAAMAGILGNAGKKGSDAGTTLKNVFIKLAAPTAEASKQLERFGVQLTDKSGNFRDVFDILEDLNKSIVGLGSAEKAAVLNDIFGKIPIAGVNILMGVGAEKLRAYRKELESATGASKTMAEMMRDTLGNRFKIFSSTLEGLKITVFKLIANNVGNITENLTALMKKTDEWLQQNKSTVGAVLGTIGGAFKVVGNSIAFVVENLTWLFNTIPAVKVLLGLFVGYKVAMLAFNAVLAITNVLMKANPLGLFITGITLVILGIRQIIKHWDKVLAGFRKVKNFMGGAVSGIKSMFGFGDAEVKATAAPVAMSPQSGMISTMNQTINKNSQVDVNFKNTPAGTQIKEAGDAKGFNLNVGFAGAGA